MGRAPLACTAAERRVASAVSEARFSGRRMAHLVSLRSRLVVEPPDEAERGQPFGRAAG